jgi:hypothetical protein
LKIGVQASSTRNPNTNRTTAIRSADVHNAAVITPWPPDKTSASHAAALRITLTIAGDVELNPGMDASDEVDGDDANESKNSTDRAHLVQLTSSVQLYPLDMLRAVPPWPLDPIESNKKLSRRHTWALRLLLIRAGDVEPHPGMDDDDNYDNYVNSDDDHDVDVDETSSNDSLCVDLDPRTAPLEDIEDVVANHADALHFAMQDVGKYDDDTETASNSSCTLGLLSYLRKIGHHMNQVKEDLTERKDANAPKSLGLSAKKRWHTKIDQLIQRAGDVGRRATDASTQLAERDRAKWGSILQAQSSKSAVVKEADNEVMGSHRPETDAIRSQTERANTDGKVCTDVHGGSEGEFFSAFKLTGCVSQPEDVIDSEDADGTTGTEAGVDSRCDEKLSKTHSAADPTSKIESGEHTDTTPPLPPLFVVSPFVFTPPPPRTGLINSSFPAVGEQSYPPPISPL